MINHKWKDDLSANAFGIKRKTCKICGIWKEWLGGKEYLCWEYIIFEQFISQSGQDITQFKTTFDRPDCLPKKK